MTGSRYLFVYGTLLGTLGHPMHQMMERDARFVGKGTFQGTMFMIGGYPGVLPSPDPADQVIGELYELHDPSTTFELLDLYEGCQENAPEFRRAEVSVRLADGSTLTAWIYLYERPTETYERVISGDFHRFIQERDRS